jgi:signal transduction histidine kinase
MNAPRELVDLADHLSQRRHAILGAWAAAARRDADLTTPSTLSRSQFYDHIPQMLDALERKLRATHIRDTLEARQDEIESAEGHGLQRWQQGYDEEEVMREWISLNACLADELESYVAAHPKLDPRPMSQAWRVFAEFAIAGMSESVAQFSLLQRSEAAGRVQALEDALKRLNELENRRAVLWREATHDLRNNLGMVTNVTHVLQTADLGVAAAENALRLLERGVGSLHALLDDLTTQARLDAGQEARDIQVFDVSVALRKLCEDCHPMATQRGLFLDVSGPEELLVEGDEVKVRRIAQNLLLNALAYTNQGGIKVSWEHIDAPPARWAMCVEDTGPGLGSKTSAPLSTAIEAATRDALAVQRDAAGGEADGARPAPTLASRSDRAALPHGEGIGLSIVKRLCELLDAAVELQTEPGKGTTFRITFPSKYPKG